MAKIDEKDKETIRKMFADIKKRVHINFFGSTTEHCDYCQDTKEILEELSSLNEMINLQVFDKNSDEAARLGVDKIPAIVFVKEDGSDTGVRFYGIPSGYEFATVIEDIIDIGTEKVHLSQKTIEQLQSLTKDVTIQVFITPT